MITLYYGVIAEHTLVSFVFSYVHIYVEDNMKIRSIARGRLSGLKHPLGLEVILVKPPNLRYWYMGIATILHVPRRGEWATPCANYMSTPSFAKIRKGSRPRQWCFFSRTFGYVGTPCTFSNNNSTYTIIHGYRNMTGYSGIRAQVEAQVR